MFVTRAIASRFSHGSALLPSEAPLTNWIVLLEPPKYSSAFTEQLLVVFPLQYPRFAGGNAPPSDVWSSEGGGGGGGVPPGARRGSQRLAASASNRATEDHVEEEGEQEEEEEEKEEPLWTSSVREEREKARGRENTEEERAKTPNTRLLFHSRI